MEPSSSCSRAASMPGSAANCFNRTLIRPFSTARVSAKVACIASSSPCALAGSDILQWLWITLPKYSGQVSLAASAHRLMTASGLSGGRLSHDLLNKPSVAISASLSTARTRGWTNPTGLLPARALRGHACWRHGFEQGFSHDGAMGVAWHWQAGI